MSVRNTVKSIQDIMRQDSGVDGDAQRISQLCWMFFLKIIDDQDQEFELLSRDYRSPIPKKYRWRGWAADPEGITGEELLTFLNGELFPALKNLATSSKPGDRRRVVKDVFEDAYNYMKSGQLMRQVVNKINGVDFNNLTERQHFGDITSRSSTTSNRPATPASTTRRALSRRSWRTASIRALAKFCWIQLVAPAGFSLAQSAICASAM
jgi:type I restriction enzyme M protein